MSAQDQPVPPNRFPIVWTSNVRDMIPPRFAIWYPQRYDFQVFNVERHENHAISVKPTTTERRTPFYFAEMEDGGDIQSRTVTLYNPRATKNPYSECAMWFTGAWLCRRNEANRMSAVIPIMCVSHPQFFPIKSNVGIHASPALHDWQNRITPQYMSEMIQNRMIFTSLHPIPELTAKRPETCAIPEYVGRALLAQAVSAEECCSITMEHLAAGDTAVTSCFHLFQKDGLVEWMKKKSCCPVCKKDDIQFILV